MILSGLQQNGGQGTEFNYETDKEDCDSIKLILEDIKAALHCEPQEPPRKCIAMRTVSHGCAECSLMYDHDGPHKDEEGQVYWNSLDLNFIGPL
jgi:hypothetical protein